MANQNSETPEQLLADKKTLNLLNSPDGILSILISGSCIEENTQRDNGFSGDVTEKALKKTVATGAYIDFSDALLALQGKKASYDDSVGTLTDLANTLRDPKKVEADGTYVIPCADAKKCFTKPFTMDELADALTSKPSKAMNPNRQVIVPDALAAEIGYLSANKKAVEYIMPHLDLEKTVAVLQAQVPPDVTHGKFKACLDSVTALDANLCVRAGIRQGLTDKVNKALGR